MHVAVDKMETLVTPPLVTLDLIGLEFHSNTTMTAGLEVPALHKAAGTAGQGLQRLPIARAHHSSTALVSHTSSIS